MTTIIHFFRRFNLFCFGISGLLLIFVTLITFFDVIGRYFRAPIPGALELTQLALSCIVFLTLAHTQTIKGHIFLDYTIPLPKNLQLILDTFLSLIGLFVMGVLAYKSVFFVIESFNSREWTDYHHIPLYLIKSVVILGGLSFCIELIIEVLENVKQRRRVDSGTVVE